MIEIDGSLRCDGCGKKLGSELKGEVKIVCPRCKRYNVFRILPLTRLTTRTDYDIHYISSERT